MSVAETSHCSGGMTNKIPLSFNQEFLCEMDKGDTAGAFSHRHTLVNGWRLSGKVDVDALQAALDDVVVRHEILRTSVHRGTQDRYQEIHPPSSVRLLVRDLPGVEPDARDGRAEELLNEVESDTFDVHDLPLLRAVLGRFDDNDSVLVLMAHHTATDAWSMQLIMRDLATCYAARRGYHTPDLPAVNQYREFAVWQQASSATATVRAACEYWREKLRDAQISALRTDRPVSNGSTNPYSVHRFLIDAELTAATVRLAKAMRSSPFMILLAVYNLLAHTLTGATDIVVPTFTSGRNESRFHDTVGPLFNFLPIRTQIAGCTSFREVAARTRASCVEAYSHDIPFAHIVREAPDLMRPYAAADRAVVAFEMLQEPAGVHGEPVGDIAYSEIRKRLLSQVVSSDIPNGMLWAMDLLPSGEAVGSLKFNTDQFDVGTMVDLLSEYRHLLRDAVTAPDSLRELP